MAIKPFAQDILPLFCTSLTVPSASNVLISNKYLYTLMYSIEIWVSNSSMSFINSFLIFFNKIIVYSQTSCVFVVSTSVWLQLHDAIYRPDSFVLMLRYCATLKAIRYESTSLNRIVAD